MRMPLQSRSPSTIDGGSSNNSPWRKRGIIAVLSVLALLLLALAFFIYTTRRWGRFVVSTIETVVQNLASHSGISKNLLYGIVIIATIPFFWAVAKYMSGIWLWIGGVRPSLRLYRSRPGMIIVAYIGLYFFAIYFVSRNSIIDKWCVTTQEGLQVFDDNIGRDHTYGIEVHRCTVEDAKVIRNIPAPQRVQIVDASHFDFFNPTTGRPQIWFYKSLTGAYEFFDRDGKYPGTGEALHPIDAATRLDVLRQQALIATEGQRHTQELLAASYINTAIKYRPDKRQVAVLVFAAGSTPSSSTQPSPIQLSTLENTLLQRLSRRGATPVTTFFKPRFSKEGRAEQLFTGDWSEATRLDLASHIDHAVLAEAEIDARESSQFESLISTNLHLELKCLNFKTQSLCGATSVDVVGAGYSREASMQNASEKARSQIESFTTSIRLD